MQTQWQVCQTCKSDGEWSYYTWRRCEGCEVAGGWRRESRSGSSAVMWNNTLSNMCWQFAKQHDLWPYEQAWEWCFWVGAVYFVISVLHWSWYLMFFGHCVCVCMCVSGAACAEPSVCCFSSSLPVPGLICARGQWPTLTFCSLTAHSRAH